MNNTLKFYGVKEGDFIIPLPGQKIDEVLVNIKIDACYLDDFEQNDKANYFEVFLSVDETSIQKIQPLNTDKIKPEALKAAKDHNEYVLAEINQIEKEDHYFNDKLFIQDIIDRLLYSPQEFRIELYELLKKFPIDVEYVRSEMGSIRKVSIPGVDNSKIIPSYPNLVKESI